jgi:hypothetical protein
MDCLIHRLKCKYHYRIKLLVIVAKLVVKILKSGLSPRIKLLIVKGHRSTGKSGVL